MTGYQTLCQVLEEMQEEVGFQISLYTGRITGGLSKNWRAEKNIQKNED